MVSQMKYRVGLSVNSRSCHVCSRTNDLALTWKNESRGVPLLPQVLPLACSSTTFGNERKPTSVKWRIRRASIETGKPLAAVSLPVAPSIDDDKPAKLIHHQHQSCALCLNILSQLVVVWFLAVFAERLSPDTYI